MWRKGVIPPVVALLAASACVPQAEVANLKNDLRDVRTELKDVKARVPDAQALPKRLDLLEQNIKGTTDLQKLVADHGARFDQLATDIQLLQGKLEENNFRIAELAQKLDDRTFKLAELTGRVELLESKLTSLPAATAAGEGGKKAGPKALSPTEAYQQAKADFDKGNFDLAIAGFENYLKQYPDASQADSAQYWIGECWYSKKDYGQAIEEFQKVLKNHGRSDKAPGARLKIGFSYLNEKNTAKAKEQLQRVVKDYPHTKEADLAREKLKKIGK